MKNTTKKLLIVGTALSILLIAAQEVQAGGLHDVRTDASGAMDWNNSAMSEPKLGSNNSGKHPRKKFVAQKKRKSSKNKRTKDRTTSNVWMFEGKKT